MMNKPSLKAYLDLIQALLSCPQGEEWILLRQHGELVNLGLVEVMEQVANHFAREGKIKAAKYLHNWSAKLHHILIDSPPNQQDTNDQTHAYLELIQALINCPEGLEQEILAANQDLINPELIKVIKQVAKGLEEKEPDTASYLLELATILNRTWLEHHQFEPSFKQEIAPDPWLDDNQADNIADPNEAKSLLNQSAIIAEEEKIPQASTSPVQATNEPLLELLGQIADSLIKLEANLTSRQQAVNPLWYMEVLEKAQIAQWILSTDEVEQLIGIKPHCHHDETSFCRGNWVFLKSGKIGAQTGWRVERKDG